MMNFKNEEAVSPVIGVILMVAITVILAAVIAAFVFGMTGNVETQKQVVLSANQIADNKLQVTVQSGADLSTLDYLRIEVTPNGGSTETYYAYNEILGASKGNTVINGSTTDVETASKGDVISVGVTFTTKAGAMTAGSDHVVIVGHFADGKQQMLIDTTL